MLVACLRSALAILLLAHRTASYYLLPNPAGMHNVMLTTGPLTDFSRNDPYAAEPSPRALMLSIFQPAECASTIPVPYMPSKTADYQGPYLQEAFNISADFSPLLREARLPVCAVHGHSCWPVEDAPILLFSPAWGIPRLYYNVLASSIASEGFIVITIDHPEDANIITYPNGHAVYQNISTWNNGDPIEDEQVRAADASFIIDQLSNATAVAQLLPTRGLRPFPNDRIGMLGHSLGGASAMIAAGRDSRLRGVINWDGTIFGSLPSAGLSQSVLLMMDAVTASPPDWNAAWPLLKGPKLWLKVANTTHQTFCDVPTLLETAGENSAAFADLLGTIAPAEMVRVLTEYTTVWMNRAFAGPGRGQLPNGQKLGESPNVSTLKRGNF